MFEHHQLGVAFGKIGSGLSADARSVPRGAELCAYQDALATPTPGAVDKPTRETCAKSLQSDALWQRAMLVLGAYSAKVEALGSGANAETAGVMEGALTHVNDASSVRADGAQEEAARDAIVQLATQLESNTSKGDLGQTVKDAAPHVKTLCDGLGGYFDAQIKIAGDAGTDIEKKRSTKADRRCAQIDGKSVCVAESVLDRMSYASAFADLHSIESSHQGARETLSSFCAAHEKLASAAQNGDLSKDQTWKDVVDAASSPPASAPSAPDAKPAEKPAAPAKK